MLVSVLRSQAPALRSIQHNLTGKSTFLFGGLMLANVVAYGYQMLLARMMSPADYGVFVTLTSISYVLAVLMRTIQASVIRAVSGSPDSAVGQVRIVFSRAIRWLVPLGAAALAIHWVASPWVGEFLHLGTTTPVIVLGLYTFSSFLVPIPRGILLGLNRLHLASAVSILEPATRLAAGVALVSWGHGVDGAVAGYAIGNLIAFSLALVPLRSLLGEQRGQRSAAENSAGLDRYALLALTVNVCLMFIGSIDQIAVKHFFSEETAGNYAVAFLLGRIIAMSTMAFAWVVFTRSATMPVDDPRRTWLFKKSLLAIGCLAAAITAGYIVAPAFAVQIMGGLQYDTAEAYVGLVGIEMTLFALVYVQAYYHISLKKMRVMWPLFAASALELGLLMRYHATVEQILLSLIFVMGGLLLVVSGLSWRIIRAARRQVAIEAQGPPAAATRVNRRQGLGWKRAIDLALAVPFIAVATPLMALIALLITLDSRGPVLFRQTRIGRDGRPFVFLKFRTMHCDADPEIHRQYCTAFIRNSWPNGPRPPEPGPAGYKLTDDPRVTRLGRLLRKASLDELPQLINVAKGEMSLVGPRPPLPYEVREYQEWHKGRLSVAPGITGWWQVNGRSRVTFDEMVRMDLHYISRQSLWLDLKILVLTIPAVISGKGAR